jgi:tetratricopeptide (TPR) repeat protein
MHNSSKAGAAEARGEGWRNGPVTESWWAVYAAALVIVLAGWAAYANSLNAPWVFDDSPSIVDNASIRRLWPLWDVLTPPENGSGVTGRPVTNLSFALNYAISGTEVWGYHATNLAIHLGAGLAMFGLVRRTLRRPGLRERFGRDATLLALAAALLWVVHPLLTESVTCVAQRTESLMGLFYFLTLYFFARSVESGRPRLWQGGAVATCLLGMATKEVMVTAPLMVLLYDRTFVAGTFRSAWRSRGRFYAGLAASWLLLAWLVVGSPARGQGPEFWQAATWGSYALTQCQAVVHYLRLAAWPSPLVLDYGDAMVHEPWQVAPQALLLLGLGGWTLAGLWRRTATGFLGAWFFVILAPSSSIRPLMLQTMAEHRMYLPLAAVIVGAVGGLYSWRGRRTLLVWLPVAMLCGWLTMLRNETYQSVLGIWTDTVAKYPDNARARNNLGLALVDAGRVPEAVVQYEEALQLEPENPTAPYNLGKALMLLGRYSEASVQFMRAAELAPDSFEERYNLAYALVKENQLPEAAQAYEEALRIKPESVEAHDNLGVVLMQLGQADRGLGHFEAAYRLAPENTEALNDYAEGLASVGRNEEAIPIFEKALQSQPNSLEAHFDLAAAYQANRQFAEAAKQYAQALQVKPDFAEAHKRLGNVLMELGRPGEAIQHYEAVLRLTPDDAEAQHNLGVAQQEALAAPGG